MASPALMSLVLACAFVTLFWIATHLQVKSASAASGLAPGSPWAPWCASEGSGRGSPAQRLDPRPSQITIDDLISRRALILRFLKGFGVPAPDAPDMANKVISGAWKSRATYDPTRAALDSWIYAIARRQAHVFLNSARVRHERLTATPIALDTPAPGDPESAAIEAESCRHALAILARIPPHLAAVWIDYHVDRLRPRDIATASQVPISIVWGWLKRARRALDRELARAAAREARAMERRRPSGQRRSDVRAERA